MPSTEPIADATILRGEGNALYKAGKVLQACSKYQQAAKLAPNDSIPSRNVSAALYELGKYKECVSRANLALKLVRVECEDDMEAQVQKLQQRIAKAKVHIQEASEEDQYQRRVKLLKTLGRYRPSMFTTTEYFTVGHDTVTSLFNDEHFERFDSDVERISFFLGGVGDARNMLQTLCVITENERKGKIPKRRYHFTANDVQKAAIARDLVIWMILNDLSNLDIASGEALQLLNTLFFVYFSTMMPPYAFQQLNSTIARTVKALSAGEQPLNWLHLHQNDVPMYIEALNSWQWRVQEIFTSAEIVEKVTRAMGGRRWPRFLANGQATYKQEKQLYVNAAVLYPSKDVLRTQDPTFLELLDKYSSEPKANAQIFKNHLSEHWHFNATLMDIEWYNDLPREAFDVGFDPFEELDHFPYDEVSIKPRNPDRLYDHVAPFFIYAAKAIKHLEGRFHVEAILGDYADVAEKFQFGLYKDTAVGGSGEDLRPRDFPVLFDRIHLSNVPDYMGGNLSTFLYAMPILRRSLAANLKASCLRNSDTWDCIETFLSEYQLIPDEATLRKLTQVNVLVKSPPEHPMPMVDYTYYMASQPSPRFTYSDLLPRKAFGKWFYALFFRLALPFNQNIAETMKIILSPLNLTIVFRLISHTCALGYPAHWLSETLTNIIENKVVTTGRPPRKKPMRAEDVRHEHPERKLCTEPFSYEMATLAQLFQPLLPFTLTSPKVPALENIYKYSFQLTEYNNFGAQASSLVLVFFHSGFLKPLGIVGFEVVKTNLRPVLDPSWGDEVDAKLKGPDFEALREKGMVMWSTFNFDIETKVASAWMPESFAEMVNSEMWTVGLYRTDTWWPAFDMPTAVKGAVRKGEKWSDVIVESGPRTNGEESLEIHA